MYNPFKTILPFVSYIPVNSPEGTDTPDLSEHEPKVAAVEKPKQESVKVETSSSAQTTPREIKIDTEAYTPAKETPKTGTVSHVVQNPYQNTDASKGNFRTSGKIIINDGVKLTDEHKQILAELSKLGISGTVSSGIREGAKTAQGKTSFHAVGQAFDFVPSAKYTSEQFKELLLTSGAYDYVKSLGYNILDETTPEIMKKTGATGPHFHFGKDPIKAKNGVKFIKPISYFEQFSNYNDYTLPELSEPIKKLFGKNSNNVREIIVGLKDAGWGNRQIAAYLGNIYVESKANPHIANKKGGDYGLVQRVGVRMEPVRSIPGLELASQLSYDIDVMAGNVSRDEMSNEWPSRNFRNEFLRGSNSVNRLTKVFMDGYERPSEKGKLSLPRRQAAAWEVYKFLK